MSDGDNLSYTARWTNTNASVSCNHSVGDFFSFGSISRNFVERFWKKTVDEIFQANLLHLRQFGKKRVFFKNRPRGQFFLKKDRGPFLTLPLGVNFDPRGEFVPQGWILSPGGEILCSPLHSSKQLSDYPLGVNIPPRGQNFTPGAKFTPRGEVRPWGPGVKLRMTLRHKIGVYARPLCLAFRRRQLILAPTLARRQLFCRLKHLLYALKAV
jgi:hypothetical protein